jgi:hypothetical protein
MNWLPNLIVLIVECGIFADGLVENAPVWYLILVGLFVVVCGYLFLDLLITELSDGMNNDEREEFYRGGGL